MGEGCNDRQRSCLTYLASIPEGLALGFFCASHGGAMMGIEIEISRAVDLQWMNRALAVASRARGRTAPNPPVGAVLVRDGVVVGEGWTERPGERHAEIMALDQAGPQARGATLYVTLEPCAHFGRTPPCTDALVDAGITRAVISVRDPYPQVDGRGIAHLSRNGIRVDLGLGAREAARINAGFFKRIRTGLPEVTAKFAMSLDGKIATHTGHARWITGPEARREAHRLRDTHDAILVGLGTVLADDPRLTTRLPEAEAGVGGPSHPLRVVVDSRARIPLTSAMLQPGMPGETLVVTTDHAPFRAACALQAAGAEVMVLPPRDGRVDLTVLLQELGRRGINRVLVEGGGALLGSFFSAGLLDRVVAFIAPVIIGGDGAPAPIGGDGVDTMDDALRLGNVEVRRFGQDLAISGTLSGIYEPEAV
ncbi:MAG TPA: bifunctional diaminohydroxyphosphoribosylaminopyrimidine deaminase/5-amino-6-(5-phosphoribosylamino)uracil reductase RibD [Nitrolancea sp.]|nr:bifunctional diaminohydroxyphosphoribosylaminopyrimidine deaminase/5-amino-6-(5-phosphoribosylamino)uracil reductase RibD [Nitrolancea sp.]